MIKKTVFLIIMIVVSALNMSAEEIDERTVLIKQAGRLTVTRKYALANELLAKVLVDYPGDLEATSKIINNFLLLAKYNEAEEILKKQQKYFSEFEIKKLKITIFLAKSDSKEAQKIADKFLSQNSTNINNYEEIAQLFERYKYFEYAITIYIKGRKISDDPYLFARKIASSLEYLGRYEESLIEYLRHADQYKSYKSYVLSRSKKMLQTDPTLIEVIGDFRKGKSNPVIIEIYGEALAYVGDIDNALIEFRKIDNNRLISFAKQQKKNGALDTAYRAYQLFIEDSKDLYKIADAKMESAIILIDLENYSEARDLLIELYNDKGIQSAKMRYKTKTNRRCREILAQFSLIIDKNPELAREYLKSAQGYAYSEKERKEIVYNTIELDIMLGQFEDAERNLNLILRDESSETDIFKTGIYYNFLLAVFNQSTEIDSFLSEMLIKMPQNNQLNDALMLKLQLDNIKETVIDKENADSVRIEFLSIYRQFNLYRSGDQADRLAKIAEKSKNEILLLLALDWSLKTNESLVTERIFGYQFEDPDFKEYVILLEAGYVKSDQERELKISDFLTEHPHSVFSPQFRRILAK